jgi:hypothetical protein
MTQEQVLQAVFAQQSDAVQQVIKRTCIVDYGVIVKVLGDNVVRVGISVANNVEDVQIITCTLVSLCSSALSVNIEAVEGDKVLVVFPRHYNPKMFDPEVTDPIIDDTVQGYTRYAGLAFLVNQFEYNAHRNNIQLTADGLLTARVPYDDNDSANILTAQTDSEGLMSLDIAKDSEEEGADLVTFTVDQEGNIGAILHQGDTSSINIFSEGKLEYAVGEDKNKITFDLSNTEDQITTISTYGVSVTTDKDNNITVDNGKASISADKDGAITITSNSDTTVTIDKNGNITLQAKGKLSLKNNSANLFTILDGMLNILNTSLATQGSPAAHTVVPSQFQTQQTQLGQLMQ